MKPSSRSEIAPFYVMEVMRAAQAREASGLDVIHLEVGQPSTPAPAGARRAVQAAIETDTLGYTGAAGLPALREAISAWYQTRYELDVAVDRIVVTTGASGGCLLAFLTMFDAGDRVAVLEPGYPCYRNDLLALGVEVVGIPVGHATGFRPSLEMLDSVGELDGLVLASPSNPTGTVLPMRDLTLLVEWAERTDTRLVIDEIYHGITYDQPAPCALAVSTGVVIVNSFSKYFSMTGWRLGWIVAPEPIARAAERLGQSLAIAAPTPSQIAGLAAFDCVDELEANVARYGQNRRLLLDGLSAIGLGPSAPADGAFYVYTDIADLHLPSPELCRRWLDDLGVATTPGIDFDPVNGHRFVRFSYAGAPDEIIEAMERIHGWLNEFRRQRPPELSNP